MFNGDTPMIEWIWIGIGLTGQFMFSMRFLLQWMASERAKRSVVPVAFWYFSIAGGAILFAYALYRQDPVFILGQGLGLFIYGRNLYFIYAERGESDRVAKIAYSDEDPDAEPRSPSSDESDPAKKPDGGQ